MGEAVGDLDGRDVDVREIGNLALRALVLRPGDARLVAWTDDVLPGLTIQPTASQSRVRTVVLVNLRFGPLPPPRPDTNLMVDVKDAAENTMPMPMPMPIPADDDLDVLPETETKDNQPPR
jgi:hypothetical protein